MYGMGFNQYSVNGQAVLQAVENYFGSADPFYLSFSEYGLDAHGALRALEQVPNVRVVRSVSGEPLNIEYFSDVMVASQTEANAMAVANAINSNAASAASQTAGVSVATHVVEQGGAAVGIGAGAVSGSGSVVGAICTKVLPALWAVGTGWSIGCAIDEALYETGNDIWNIGSMRAYNPAYWDNILFDKDVLGNDNPTMTGLLDANGQMYTDERMLAYLVGYLNSLGVFGGGNPSTVSPYKPSVTVTYSENQPLFTLDSWNSGSAVFKNNGSTSKIYTTFCKNIDGGDRLVIFSEEPLYLQYKIDSGTWRNYSKTSSNRTSHDNVYYGLSLEAHPFISTNVPINDYTGISDVTYDDIVDAILDGTPIYPTPVEGISKRTGYDYPDISESDTIDQILNKLKQQYPDLWTNKLKTSMPDDQGNIQERTYVPMGIPDGGTDRAPTISDNASPRLDPSNPVQDRNVVTPSTPTGNPTDSTNNPDNGNDTGTGSVPTVILPNGSCDSLYTVYNPTEAELNAFGAWLWSSNFVDQLLKVFNDPMQAIIGLHRIFTTPLVHLRQNITVGYLDSGVPANKVSSQYVTDDLGYVDLKESFGNVFDYAPYTKISLYLPFIGFVNLDPADVMRSKLNVRYHTDVLTGTLFVEVRVKRDTNMSPLYTFNGDGAVHYPLSSGSYMGIVASAVSLVAGGAAAALIPGAMAGAAAMTAAGNLSSGIASGLGGVNIGRSGSFSGNSGAMGCKTPYLVITRPQTRVARTFPQQQGYPSNFSTALGNCYGFTRVKTALLSSISNATEREKRMLEEQLKNGVLI